MDRQEARTAWIIAGILAVLLVIAVIFWMNAKKDLDTVLAEGQADIGAMRDKIAVDCHASDADSKKRCQEDLDDLSSILTEFSKNLDKAAPEGTTSPQPQ